MAYGYIQLEKTEKEGEGRIVSLAKPSTLHFVLRLCLEYPRVYVRISICVCHYPPVVFWTLTLPCICQLTNAEAADTPDT